MKCLLAIAVSSLLFVSLVPTTGANGTNVSQEFRSGISGRITDQNGAVVVGARITIIARSSNQRVSRTSNDQGQYAADLTPGNYDLLAEANGFKKATRQSIPVEHQSRPYVDFVLEVNEE